jgi:hypothetical protein
MKPDVEPVQHNKNIESGLSNLKKFFYVLFVSITAGVFVGFISMFLKIRAAIERKRII